ncbi:hypothetical protein C8R44DRAFT_878749 [Mycena epipterygia]|nr:hypothetical protein C8R44DRAFT_878749 [Mycena epipterygia]
MLVPAPRLIRMGMLPSSRWNKSGQGDVHETTSHPRSLSLAMQNAYVRLPDSKEEEFLPVEEKGHRTCAGGGSLRTLLALSVLLHLVLAFTWARQWHPHKDEVPVLYSPAQSAIEYKLVKFTRGFGEDTPIYEQPPSAAVDEAWEALHRHPETRISRFEAAKMSNNTWPIVGDEGHYIMALEVLHQLHCLDIMRKQLHPGFDYPVVDLGHIRHCIGTIRQALMCAADITPIVWQWSETQQRAEQRDDIVQVCRDYGKIQEWVESHFVGEPFPDLGIYVESDLDIPAF